MVAGGSQFFGENFKKFIVYTVIVIIPRQTALIGKNRHFFTLIEPCHCFPVMIKTVYLLIGSSCSGAQCSVVDDRVLSSIPLLKIKS